MPVPEGLGLREAAALLHDGPTALGLFENARVEPEEWVLVLGAGGGLGILLVQLARAADARVVGAARGTRKLDLARELGADAAIDYSEPGWAVGGRMMRSPLCARLGPPPGRSSAAYRGGSVDVASPRIRRLPK